MPIKMPAFGLSAVPLPTNSLRKLSGFGTWGVLGADAAATDGAAGDCARRGAITAAAAGLLRAPTCGALDTRVDVADTARLAGLPGSVPRDVDVVRSDAVSPVSAEALAARPTAVAEPMPNATANAPMRPTWVRRPKPPLAPVTNTSFDMDGSPGRGSETALGPASVFVPGG